MKREDVRNAYYDYSGKASDVARQLAIAGLAVIWLLRPETALAGSIPRELFPSTIFLVIALTFDLLHYVAGSVVWGFYNWRLDRSSRSNKPEFLVPRQMNWPTNICFWAKLGCLMAAYGMLAQYWWRLLSS